MKSLSKRIRVKIKTLQDHLDLAPYSKPRSFYVTYTVRLQSDSDKPSVISLIVPIPSDSEYQQVNHLKFNKNPSEINSEKKCGNKYAQWKLELPPFENREYAMQFEALIKPRKCGQIKFTLDQYQHQDKNLTAPFLSANAYINPSDPVIKKIAAQIIGEEKDLERVIKAINEYVIQSLSYGNPIDGLHDYQSALRHRSTDCGGYDTFLISLLRSVGIPSRVVSGFWLGYPNMKNCMHAWMELMLPSGEWIPLDPSSEQLFRQGRMWASGRLGYTGSDRLAMSFGEDMMLESGNGKITTDILQNPIIEPKKSAKVELNFESQQ